jgi:uncharacterized protein
MKDNGIDVLFQYQENLLGQVDNSFYRSLFDHLPWGEQMFGITGLRGTGKTTMLLQYLKYKSFDSRKVLYITADHIWFYKNKIYDLADGFVLRGGDTLLIDEIHKYPNWSRELKNIYDGYPRLKVIFTASSTLDILKGEADLSRRALTYRLNGLSFREFLELYHNVKFPVIPLDDLLKNAIKFSGDIADKIKPIPYFDQYLKQGYFPFGIQENSSLFTRKLIQVINTVMEVDMQIMEHYSASNTEKIKKLLGVIASTAPFEPNISKLAGRLNLGRDTVKHYLLQLEKARLLNLISRNTKGIAYLQKPDKIYLENTNLMFALDNMPDKGALRETFFLNQLRNAGHEVKLTRKADFEVNNRFVFEIGGPSKNEKQILNIKDSWLVIDDIERAYLNRIPLWLFGFLY